VASPFEKQHPTQYFGLYCWLPIHTSPLYQGNIDSGTLCKNKIIPLCVKLGNPDRKTLLHRLDGHMGGRFLFFLPYFMTIEITTTQIKARVTSIIIVS
jgi:hypothetical protein